MIILGLDVGDRRIGVAVSDELGYFAHGVKIIKRGSLKQDITELKEIISRLDIGQLVVGLPKNLDGSIGAQAEKVLKFIKQLEYEINLQINTWDERFSTQEAERTLNEAGLNWRKQKKVKDKLAAVIILQGYLDLLQNTAK